MHPRKSESLACVTISSGLQRNLLDEKWGTLPMSLFINVTFFEVSMALLFVGMTERLLLGYAPAEMVGAKGWLIRSDIEE